MSDAAYKLGNKIVEVISRPHFQPGYPNANGKPVTWCNEAANAVLVELGFDTRPILEPRGIGWTYSTRMVENAIRCAAAGGCGVFEVSTRQAQAWADIGVPVLAAANDPKGKQPGHLGIVCPTDQLWNPKAGPWIGQAGAVNGFRSAFDSFQKWGLNAPRFFILPLKA